MVYLVFKLGKQVECDIVGIVDEGDCEIVDFKGPFVFLQFTQKQNGESEFLFHYQELDAVVDLQEFRVQFTEI